MRFSRKRKLRTAGIGTYEFDLADDFCRICRGHQPFCWNEKVLLRENGGIFMLTSLGLIFLLGLLMAAACQKIHLPRIIGMLLTGIILGALCAESVGCVDPEYLIGTAADRVAHYFAEGRVVAGSEGSEKSGEFRSHVILCSGDL